MQTCRLAGKDEVDQGGRRDSTSRSDLGAELQPRHNYGRLGLRLRPLAQIYRNVKGLLRRCRRYYAMQEDSDKKRILGRVHS